MSTAAVNTYTFGVRLHLASMVMVLALGAAAHADGEGSEPEHLSQAFLQFGLAFTAEFVAAPGPMCSVAGASGCILGTGGGLTLRVGKRFRSPFYLGGSYEFAKMDSAQLYRVGILQQLRAEGRWYLSTRTLVQPYLGAALGIAAYGNLWAFPPLASDATVGLAMGLGAGIELQLSTYVVMGLSVHYRPILFAQFTDSSEGSNPPAQCSSDPSCHPAGVAHLIGIDLIIETRDPL